MKKKLIALLLAISASFSLASCDMSSLPIIGGMFGNESSSSENPAKTYDLEGAKKLLDSRIKGLNADSNEDYDLPKDLLFGGETYTLTWSVNVTENVEIVVEKDGSVWVDVNEALVEEFAFILTAKITAPDGTSIDANFNRKISAIERYVPVAITEKPVEGTAYKLSAYNPGKGADLYLSEGVGARDYYLKTATEYDQGVDIFAEHVEGSTEEFYLYYNVAAAEGATAKQYLKLVVEGDKVRSYLSETPFAFKFSAEYGVYCESGEKICIFGTESGYDSISGTTYPASGVMSPAYLITKLDRSQVDAEDKLAHEVESLSLAPMFVGGGDDASLVMHGTRYPDVKITWESNSEAITINRRTMSFAAVTETTEVTLTATLTIDGKTETKPVSVKVVANNATAILAAAESLEHNQAFGNEVTLTGTMLRFVATSKDDGTYSEQYESITFMMSVDGKEVEGYRMKGLTTEAKDAQPGDILTCKGELLKYYDTLEFSFGKIINRVEGETPDDGGNGGNTETTGTSIDIESYATANSWTTNTLYSSVSTSDYSVTVSATPVGTYGQNTGKYYIPSTSNAYHSWRMYQNENPSIVVSAATGKYITSIKITYVSEKTGVLLLDGVQVASDAVVTASASAVTFNVGNTTTETKGQVRITAIEVVCAEGTGTGTVTPPAGGDQGGTDNENQGGTTTAITAPEENKAYLMSLYQGNLQKTLYLTGTQSGDYLATTENVSEAAYIYAEAATGGYKFYVKDANDAKSYIALTEYKKADKNYYSASIAWAADGTVFAYNTAGCWAATLANDTFFIGTNQSFTTVSASGQYYMSSIGTSNFPLLLEEVTGTVTPPAGGDQGGTGNEGGNQGTSSWTPVENVAYAFYITQSDGTNYYFTGETDNNYKLYTSLDADNAADVYVEKVDTGYNFTVTVNNTKKYMGLVVSGTYINLQLVDQANAAVFNYNTELTAWWANVNGTDVYIGTYNTNTHIQNSKLSFLSDDPSKIGVTQFPAQFMTAEEAAALAPTESERVSVEMQNVTIANEVTGVKTIDLVTGGKTYKKVTISYAVTEGTEVANIVDGKLVTVNPTADTTVKVVATFTSGSYSETKEFIITVKATADNTNYVTKSESFASVVSLGAGSYFDSRTTTNGWTVKAARADATTAIATTDAITLCYYNNVKGSLVSPTLTGGIKSLTFKYGATWSESKIGFTVKITVGGQTYTETVSLAKDTDYTYGSTVLTFNYEFETYQAGDFKIEILNDCPSQSDKKSRLTIWDLSWVTTNA